MRFFSLPFDWTYITNVKALEYLSVGFETHFKDFFKKENLIKVDNKEHHICYKDLLSNYYFPNHFEKEIETENDYLIVKNKLNRRINRLYEYIENSKNVLFLLSTYFEFELTCIEKLYTTLIKIFPIVNFDFKIIQFSCKKNEIINHYNSKNIEIYKYIRSTNRYDFYQTNYEWSFLDEIKLSNKFIKNSLKKESEIRIKLFSLNFFKLFHLKLKLLIQYRKIRQLSTLTLYKSVSHIHTITY